MRFYLIQVSGAEAQAKKQSAEDDGEKSIVGALTVTMDSALQDRREIDKFPFVLGRLDESDFTLADPRVSKRHCMITNLDNELFIQDLNSTNGTEVRGKRIDKRTPINHGDLITMGLTTFRLVVEDS
jgi:pSer/pThr/pTyr-binding forkhead associated (FHA) protein